MYSPQRGDFSNISVHPLNFLINDLLNHMVSELLIIVKTSEVSTESVEKENTFIYVTDKLCSFEFSLKSLFILSKYISIRT